jgi:hypothetical protein
MVRWTLVLWAGVAVMIGVAHLPPFISSLMRDRALDYRNIWAPGEPLDAELRVSARRARGALPPGDPIWAMRNVSYRKWKAVANTSITIPLPDDILANATTYFLRLVVRASACARANCPAAADEWQLIRWHCFQGNRRHRLLNASAAPAHTPFPFHFKTARFDLLYEDRPRSPTVVHPLVFQLFGWQKRRHVFTPPLTADTFFDIPSQGLPINLSNANITIGFEFNIRGYYLWLVKRFVDYSFYLYEFSEIEWQSWKSDFINANPILLWGTMLATALHSIFQFLAFQSDLRFWRRKKSLVGVSMRDLAMQCASQMILLCYLVHNERNVPLFILGIQCAAIALDLWKLTKLLKLRLRFPFVEVREEYRGETDEADAQGMRYLSWILVPLVIAYAVYQLLYSTHTSYVAYLLHCSAGAIYAFGFLLMLPQVYVNYRLKTVAGMNRLTLAYKFLNTFIDDLYAFLSSCSLMYKIACFRDDVIFVIWLFQCCIYPVDPSCPNEFNMLARDQDLSEEDEKEKLTAEEEEEEARRAQKVEWSEGKVKTD